VRDEAGKLGLDAVYVDFFRAITLAEASSPIEEAYLGRAGRSSAGGGVGHQPATTRAQP